jgi:hypothetical protein
MAGYSGKHITTNQPALLMEMPGFKCLFTNKGFLFSGGIRSCGHGSDPLNKIEGD